MHQAGMELHEFGGYLKIVPEHIRPYPVVQLHTLLWNSSRMPGRVPKCVATAKVLYSTALHCTGLGLDAAVECELGQQVLVYLRWKRITASMYTWGIL
jgi:hypothetical protein